MQASFSSSRAKALVANPDHPIRKIAADKTDSHVVRDDKSRERNSH
jgi:hypothetical protein